MLMPVLLSIYYYIKSLFCNHFWNEVKEDFGIYYYDESYRNVTIYCPCCRKIKVINSEEWEIHKKASSIQSKFDNPVK